MNISYMIYQAEHVRTARQQREEDNRAGELAADFGQLWHSLAHRRNGSGQRGFRQAPEIEMLSEDCACSGRSAA
jgi:hypothetical protein